MPDIDPRNIFPCVTPASYFEGIGLQGVIARPLGHHLLAMLWTDAGNVIQSFSPAALAQMKISEEEVWALAMENLDRVVQAYDIPLAKMEFDAGEAVFAAGPHWLASALVLHRGFHALAAKHVGAQDLQVMLPARENAVFFSAACSAQMRQNLRQIAAELAGNSRKPFGANLFGFSPAGVQPIEGV